MVNIVYTFKYIKKVITYYYSSDLISCKHIKEKYNISKSTLFYWINNRINNKIIKNAGRKKKTDKLVDNYIINYITNRKYFKIEKLIQLINKRFAISVSKGTIYNRLKESNVTYKRLHLKMYKKQKRSKKTIKDFIKLVNTYGHENIISIDESSIELNMHPHYGWSKKGTKCNKIIYKTPKRQKVTLLLAISNNKIIEYEIFEKTTNGNDFYNYLNDKLLPKCKNKYLLMDNARIHHYIPVKNLVSNTNNQILYNIPYTPETNPIEYIFSKIKSFIRYHIPTNLINLKKLIKKALKTIKSIDLDNCFNHSFNIKNI